MTEKRFTYNKPLIAFSKGGIHDNITGNDYEFTDVFDLLNALHEENNNLKQALWEAESDYIHERYEYSFEIEQELDDLKKEFERGYWND